MQHEPPEPTPLTALLLDHISHHGPVTFAEFMQSALYHPEFGYYTRGPNIGPRGDFTTSPEASPAFGRLLARHVVEVDALLGSPATLDVVECGPGRGTLARDLLSEVADDWPDVYARIKYHMVEVSPALVEMQRSLLLPRHAGRIDWYRSVPAVGSELTGAFIANELVDAFPVHVVEMRDGSLVEHYVGADDNGLRIEFCPLSTPALAEFVQRNNLTPGEGDRIEINLAVEGWLAEVSHAFSCCVALLIDYGDTAPARYSESRRTGTLLGYYGGRVTDDVLAHAGAQDLTALVDFTALQHAARDAGLQVVGMTRQANLLIGLGLGTEVAVTDEAMDLEDAMATRRGLQALVSMEGLGRFHVLVLSKGLDPQQVEAGLSGLRFAGIA